VEVLERPTQLQAVHTIMRGGNWFTLPHLRVAVRGLTGKGISEAGLSARIRDMRKSRYYGATVERRATKVHGLYEYRLLPDEVL
jgi:hypothetical protein